MARSKIRKFRKFRKFEKRFLNFSNFLNFLIFECALFAKFQNFDNFFRKNFFNIFLPLPKLTFSYLSDTPLLSQLPSAAPTPFSSYISKDCNLSLFTCSFGNRRGFPWDSPLMKHTFQTFLRHSRRLETSRRKWRNSYTLLGFQVSIHIQN